MVKQHIFDSGLRLLVETKKNSKIISTGIMVNVGAVNENPEEYGLAHFVEHTLFKSTKNYNFKEISKKLEGLGIKYNASTSKQCTYFYMDCIKDSLNETYELFADMFYNGIYDKEEIENERRVVLEEMNMCDDFSYDILLHNLMNNMYNGSIAGHRVIGDRSVIENATPETLKAFKEKYYTPDNMVVTIVGNITFDEAYALVEKHFNKDKNLKATFTPRLKIKVNPKIVKKYDSVQKDEKQITLAVLIKAPRVNEKEYDALNVYSKILGGGRCSRLFDTLREKEGLCYMVDSSTYSNTFIGALMIFVSTSKENVAHALTSVKTVLKDICNSVTEEELNRAKVSLKTDLIFAGEINHIMARSNASELYDFGKIISIEKESKKIDRVTLDDINKIALKIASEKHFTVCAVGDSVPVEDLKNYS